MVFFIMMLTLPQTIEVLSYNVQGLPPIITPYYSPERYKKIQNFLVKNKTNIVLLQETWTDKAKRLLPEQGIIKRLDTKISDSKWYGSGLSFGVYGFNRIFYNYKHFKTCARLDCLASKGFQVIIIEIGPDKYLDVYNVHLQAHGWKNCKRAREEQIIELSEFINEYSKEHAVIVGGDFNFNINKRKEEFNLFIELTQTKAGTTKENVYDHIFFRDGPDVKLFEIEYEYNYKNLEKLSDHKPVYKKFKVIF